MERAARGRVPSTSRPVLCVQRRVDALVDLRVLGGLVSIAGIWSVFIAFQYAKLWTDGYDWRDVFRQPKDRLFFDVVAEWMDNVRAIWDRNKRSEIRARGRLAGAAERCSRAISPGFAERLRRATSVRTRWRRSPVSHAATVRDAARKRDDIVRNVRPCRAAIAS